MGVFVKSKEFQQLNVGFALDEGLANAMRMFVLICTMENVLFGRSNSQPEVKQVTDLFSMTTQPRKNYKSSSIKCSSFEKEKRSDKKNKIFSWVT